MRQQQHNHKGGWYSWMFSRMTLFFGLGVLAAGTYVADYLSTQPQQAQHAHKHDPGVKHSLIPHTTKARSPMHASIELIGNAPTQSGDEFGLKVIMRSDKPVENINARWVIPDGIELLQGTTKDHLDRLDTDNEISFFVQLKQVSDVNEQIHFKASANHSGMRSSLTLQYNSLDQSEIDRKNENLRELASEQMKKDLAIDSLQKEKALKDFKPAQ
jgi:hypothetical protein